MEVRRLDPSAGGLANILKNIEGRVAQQETRASGDVVIRQTLTTTDPVTGVSTVFGQLPDGSVGIQPFVGDTTPPPVPTTPIVNAKPGSVLISWDGQFVASAAQPRDFEHLNVIGHKVVGGLPTSTVTIGALRLPTESIVVPSNIAAVGETWCFGFTSEDYNKNKSIESINSASVMVSGMADDPAISAHLSSLDTALTAVETTADGKNAIYYNPSVAPSAPAGVPFRVGDLWFDTANDNRISTWSGTAWGAALLGNNAIYANIDAGKMTVGTLAAARLSARSITADKLVLVSTDNVMPEGDFSAGGIAWGVGGAYSIDPTGSRNGTTSFKIVNNNTQQLRLNTTSIPMDPLSAFRVSVWVKSDVGVPASGVSIYAQTFDISNTPTTSLVSFSAAASSNTYVKLSGMFTVPAGAIKGTFGFGTEAAFNSGNVWFDSFTATRAGDSNLLVDGAIDGKTITGAIVRTAATGARIQLDSTGLHGWDASNVNYLTADSTGITVTGTLKATGTGYDYSIDPVYPTPIPVDMVVGGAAGGVITVHSDQYPPPAPASGSPIPGIAIKPTGTTMFSYAQLTSIDGLSIQLSSGMRQATIDADSGNIDLVYPNRLTATPSRTLFTKPIYAPAFQFISGSGATSNIVDTPMGITGSTNNTRTMTISASTVSVTGDQTISGTLTVGTKLIQPVKHFCSNLLTSYPTTATMWGPGTFTRDATHSSNDSFVSFPANDQIQFVEAGVYSVQAFISNHSTTYTASRVYIQNYAQTYTHAAVAKSEAGIYEFNVGLNNYNATAGEIILLHFYHEAGVTMQWDTLLRVTKIQ